MCAVFQKKCKKGKIIENSGKNAQNLQIFWKRAVSCMQLSHTWNKQLEYPLHEQEHQVSAERHFLQQVIGKVPEMVLVALWNSWLIVCIEVSTPLKNTTTLVLAKPHLNCHTVQAPPPPFRQSPPLYWFFVNPPPWKSDFSVNPQKSFSSLIPSYLLKVTKFLGKISQFEFLVMTDKFFFAYKLFLSLNIWDFN